MDGVLVIVTGFGAFSGVEDNPSKRIVEHLLATNFQCETSGVNFQYQILEVSVKCCSQIHDSYLLERANTQIVTIFVHIGVDSGADSIKLEECAYNNMDFRVPDIEGYQPLKAVISQNDVLDSPLRSSLPLAKLCDQINASTSRTAATIPLPPPPPHPTSSASGTTGGGNGNKVPTCWCPQICGGDATNSVDISTLPVVKLSQDPGRYLCNYVYYQALIHQQSLQQPLYSLFVHVPSFATIDQSVQINAVKVLLNNLAKQALDNTAVL